MFAIIPIQYWTKLTPWWIKDIFSFSRYRFSFADSVAAAAAAAEDDDDDDDDDDA